MAFDVHIHLCFACQDNGPVAELASRHLPRIKAMEMDDGVRYAIWFLEDVAKRSGVNPGPKGGLLLWGMVGNYTLVDRFCDVLGWFWTELLSREVGGICRSEHVVVFEEREQSEAATAYEIALANQHDASKGITITKHDRLRFSWMQY